MMALSLVFDKIGITPLQSMSDGIMIVPIFLFFWHKLTSKFLTALVNKEILFCEYDSLVGQR